MTRTPIAFAEVRNFLGALFLACLIGACATGLVARTTVEGRLDVRTDGAVLVALGEGTGSYSVTTQGVGFPVAVPFSVEGGFITVVDLASGTVQEYAEGAALPDNVAALFGPGELPMSLPDGVGE